MLRAPSPINCTNESTELPVAASALETDSVEGQRSRPSAVTRLDLLKVVGSRPERLASPGGRQAGALGQPVQRGPDLLMGQRFRRFRPVCHDPASSGLGNYCLNPAAFRNRDGAAGATPLKCAGPADTVRPRSGTVREIPSDSTTKQDFRITCAGSTNLFRLGLARSRAQGIYRGSADDARDGFIHFSTAAQVAGTAVRHFLARPGCS